MSEYSEERRVVNQPVEHTDVRHQDLVEVKNRVQAMPIIAGVLTAIATMLILTVLGIAIGASALEPRSSGDTIGTAAAVWGIISAIISFFLGGWVAAKTAAVAGVPSGVLNGVMVGAAVLTLVLWLASSGVSGLVGSLGSNIGDIVNIAEDKGLTSQAIKDEVQDVQDDTSNADAQDAFDTVRDSAWGTLAGLIVPLVAAGAGGAVGHNEREDVIQGG